MKVGHKKYECAIVCLLNIALLTHASICPMYTQRRALSLQLADSLNILGATASDEGST